jgi:hypothetical protein
MLAMVSTVTGFAIKTATPTAIRKRPLVAIGRSAVARLILKSRRHEFRALVMQAISFFGCSQREQ